MKIKLELEDFRFATTRHSMIGEVRWLLVKVGEREFSVFLEVTLGEYQNYNAAEWVDRLLVEKMEVMLAKVFTQSCEAIKPGTQILDEEGQ